MKVIRASTAGFCLGVSLALKKLENAIQTGGRRICTLGPIIHNPQALAEYEAKGVVSINTPEDATYDDLVLIRAHGIPREVEQRLGQICSHVEDATCPKVKQAQLSIAKATAGGTPLLLFGEAQHPEVAGLISYAAGPAIVFGSLSELEKLDLPTQRRVVLASQTTQDREAFETIAKRLKEIYPGLKVLQTICDATRQRQREALELAGKVDIMVVVGGRTSGNTRRLASLAADCGIATLHIETAAELKPEVFAGKNVAGLTAGASTPKNLIDETCTWLESL